MLEEQSNELEKITNDIEYFIQFVKVKNPVKGIIDFKLEKYQKEILKYMKNDEWIFFEKSRRIGMTHLLAIHTVFKMITIPNYNILYMSNYTKMANHFVDTLRTIIFHLSDNLMQKFNVEYTVNNLQNIKLSNGSKIELRSLYTITTQEYLSPHSNYDLYLMDECGSRGNKYHDVLLEQLACVYNSLNKSKFIGVSSDDSDNLFHRYIMNEYATNKYPIFKVKTFSF